VRRSLRLRWFGRGRFLREEQDSGVFMIKIVEIIKLLLKIQIRDLRNFKGCPSVGHRDKARTDLSVEPHAPALQNPRKVRLQDIANPEWCLSIRRAIWAKAAFCDTFTSTPQGGSIKVGHESDRSRPKTPRTNRWKAAIATNLSVRHWLSSGAKCQKLPGRRIASYGRLDGC